MIWNSPTIEKLKQELRNKEIVIKAIEEEKSIQDKKVSERRLD